MCRSRHSRIPLLRIQCTDSRTPPGTPRPPHTPTPTPSHPNASAIPRRLRSKTAQPAPPTQHPPMTALHPPHLRRAVSRRAPRSWRTRRPGDTRPLRAYCTGALSSRNTRRRTSPRRMRCAASRPLHPACSGTGTLRSRCHTPRPRSAESTGWWKTTPTCPHSMLKPYRRRRPWMARSRGWPKQSGIRGTFFLGTCTFLFGEGRGK